MKTHSDLALEKSLASYHCAQAVLFIIILLTAAFPLQPLLAQGLTREQAMKIGSDNDGVGNGTFWYEHGDSSPPFTHAGHIIISYGNHVVLTLNDREISGLGVDSPYDDGRTTRLDIYTSAKGKGWVVTHVLKPEVEASRPKPPRDTRPDAHKALSSAAEMAVNEGDRDFLALLFKRGLKVNVALDFEKGDTLLHTAAHSGKLKIVKYLLQKGADPALRDRHGRRPIDIAISIDNKELCALFAKPENQEPAFDGVPADLIQELLSRNSTNEMVFVKWNGKDPTADLLTEIRKTLPKARPASKMIILDRSPLGAHSWYQDKETKEFGSLIEVSLTNDGAVWNTTVRDSVGPVMAGGGWGAKARKKYGYWYLYDENGWDE